MGIQVIKDIIDILLVAILLFESYKLLKKSGAVSVFIGVFAFILVWFLVSRVFEMQLLGGLLDKFIDVGAIALIVIFQDEIRTFFSRIGNNWQMFDIFKQLSKKVRARNKQQEADQSVVQIVLACKNMSKTKTGALIVFTRKQDLQQYAMSGERISALISSRLIENIFFKNSPLHDGALLITGGRLHSATCILPISKKQNIPKQFGLRHRAALGIAEKTDAIAVVVSEETGNISYVIGDEIKTGVKPEELEQMLSKQWYDYCHAN